MPFILLLYLICAPMVATKELSVEEATHKYGY